MDDLKDYAYPTMMAEKALKDLHQAMLDRDLDRAKVCGVEAGIQVMKVLKVIYLNQNEG